MRAGIAVVAVEAMRNYLLEEVLLQVRAGIVVAVEAMRNYLLEEEMRNYLLEEAV